MDLASPQLLLAAWVGVPALVAGASLALGIGLRLVAGVSLGPLTAPAGFLAGVAIMTTVLRLGGGGALAALICTAVSVAGGVAGALAVRRRRSRSVAREEVDVVTGRSRRAALSWPAVGATAAYAVALAPLVGSGRSGVLGYLLNNDSAVHIPAAELLRLRGAGGGDYAVSSFHSVQYLNASGYPLGGHVWPMWGTVVTGLDPFHLWTPVIALGVAMLALVAYGMLRELSVSRPVAALAGAVVACGYLPYSYLAQGGAKEVMLPVAVYAGVALFPYPPARVRPRAFLPAGAAALSALALFGAGALAWVGPAAVLCGAILLLRAGGARARVRTAAVLAVSGMLAAALALPGLVQAVAFLRRAQGDVLGNDGNLFFPVPVWQAFNIWLARDYRFPVPEEIGLTALGVAVAAVLAVAGVVHAVRTGRPSIPVAVAAAGVAAAYVVALPYSAYFEVKTYAALAPALGMATVAGVVWLFRRGVRTQLVAVTLGAGLALGVTLGCVYVYTGAWLTPRDRFEEAAAIADRFAGQGPMLVNEREDYAKHLLRAVQPWETWSPYSPKRATPDELNRETEHTPDFDDYEPPFLARFPLLLERRRPGGSRPPGNYRVVHETAHYRVWRRSGPAPRRHVRLGTGTVAGTAPLDCGRPGARAMLDAARRAGHPLRVATARPSPTVLAPPAWSGWRELRGGPEPGFVERRGGVAVLMPRLAPGRYTAWAKGSYGLGIRLLANGRVVGEVRDDMGLFANWHRLGSFEATRRTRLALVGLDRPLWRTGSRRRDISGPLALVREGRASTVTTVPAGRARSLCGRELDWVEVA